MAVVTFSVVAERAAFLRSIRSLNPSVLERLRDDVLPIFESIFEVLSERKADAANIPHYRCFPPDARPDLEGKVSSQ